MSHLYTLSHCLCYDILACHLIKFTHENVIKISSKICNTKMNRNQRRLGRYPKRTDSEARVKVKHGADTVVEVFPPRVSKKEINTPKQMTNRCCHVSPDQREFGQLTDEYQEMQEQYGFNPIIPDTITQLQELRRMLCGDSHKLENGSQYTKPVSAFVETSDGAQWQNVENSDDIDRFILGKDEETLTQCPNSSKSIFISEVPRVKIIVEKFSRFKQNNVELRKLDEKVVCVEYDVFDNYVDDSLPVQIMRAFFSIKPVYDEEDDKTRSSLSELPPTVKNKFNIAFEDLQKLSEKEVEMIDGKIAENQPYLDDLRKILRRKQVVSKKNKNSLDTQTLYEMATMEYLNFERDNTNLLSKDELQEVKDLILKKCKSSVHGISRRTVKCESEIGFAKEIELSAISKSIVAELMRQEGKDDLK